MSHRIVALAFLLSAGLERSAAAQSLPPGFTEETVATGLRQPLTMYWAPDGRLFVNERVGQLRIIRNNQLLPDPFLTLNVNLSVIRGLMAFAFDPNFAANRYIYVYYNPPATESFRVSRFRAQAGNPDLVEAGSELVLYSRTYNTFDSTREILFGPDGKMYMGGAEGNIRRIDPLNFPNVIPSDNPTAGSDLWATGLRNPSGLAFDPSTGRLYANDAAWHAGQGGEKIREISRGSAPIVYSYDHAEAAGALTAGVFYRATHLPAQYQGSYFFVDHVQGTVRRRDPSGTVTVFATGLRYPIDLKVGPDGNLYYTDLGVLGAEFSPEFTNPSPIGTVRRIRYTPPAGGPVVTVTVGDPNASETGPDPGTFTIARTGSTTSPLAVTFSVGGTATSGDYASIGTSVTIPAGASSVSVTVTPVDDSAAEGSETVILTLSASSAYTVGTPASATVTIADNEPAPTLVLAFAFDEGAGTTAQDSSGNGRTGALQNGAGWGAGRFGQALNLDGVNDYVAVAGPNLPPNDYTWMLWVNPDRTNVFQTLLEGQDGTNGGVLELNLTSTGALEVWSNGARRLTSAGTVPAGTWTHVALTRSGSTLRVYLNGIADANTGSDGAALPFSADPMLVGVDADSGGSGALNGYLDGRIDELRVYSRALSPSEIQGDLNSPIGTGDATPPSAPTGLAATAASTSQINLSWTAATDNVGVTGYRVLRDGTEIATVTGTTYQDTGLAASTTYTYTVRAFDAAGNLSSPSASASATTLSPAPTVSVSATDGFAAEPGADTGEFTFARWGGSTAGGLGIAYTVSGSASAGSDYTALSGTVVIPAGQTSVTVTVTPLDDSAVEPGETVIVTIQPAGAYTIGTASATVTIADNEVATDSDGDGMADSWENQHFGNLNESAAGDFDGDGLINIHEFHFGGNPRVSDSDGDGMPDGWEYQNSLSITADDAAGDPDLDGFTNLEEFQAGTNPNDPLSVPGGGGGGGGDGGGGCGALGLEALLFMHLCLLARRRIG
jgi:glucose/arabinose dehydrogenase/chitodextrinase